jgi:hypothetical protein
MYEYRCDERLKDKGEESTCLVYTGLFGGLEHLKIETRLIDVIDERFTSVMGECDLEDIGGPSIFKAICSDTVLVRMLSILDLI